MSAGNNWWDGLHMTDTAAGAVVEMLKGLNGDAGGEPTYRRLVDDKNGQAGVCVVMDKDGNPVYFVTVTQAA